MRGGTIQINWHNTQPVLALDFDPVNGILATGGSDHDVKIWAITPCESQKNLPTVSYQRSLPYHTSAVNAIRFSPPGELLASGADGGELIIWKSYPSDDGNSWKVLKTLLFHRKDVLDLQWSSDSSFLVSGSVDNSCIIWDINKGSVHQILDAHLHYVQGVAWDPLGQYLASLSSDRTCRIYMNKPQPKVKGHEKVKYVCQHVVTKSELQKPDGSKSSSTRAHLFHDETLPSFFRRLAWSPDGSFLLVPAGMCKLPTSEIVHTSYIFSRKDLSRPAIEIPAASKPAVVVRFCPVVFHLLESNQDCRASCFKLPYRVVFAIATLNSLYIYDTQCASPIAAFVGLHYAAITDIAWSMDAKFVALSSRDGYCTIVQFEKDELGSPYPLAGAKKASELSSEIPAAAEACQPMDALAVTQESRKVDEVSIHVGSQTQPIKASDGENKNSKRRITPSAINL